MRKFKRVYIETTNVCNLSCSFCPKTKREKKFMSDKEFEIILKKIKPYTNYIYLHLMGEPLLNSNLETFLEIAKENDFKVNITTNGTLITKNKNILLKSEALRQINISMHSFEANENEISFEKYFKEILEFIVEANEKTDIITGMRLWNLDGQETRGENSLNEKILSMLKEYFNVENLVLDKKNKIRDKVYLNPAEKFDWPDMNIKVISEEGFCHGMRDHFGILVDGTVVPCCLDSEGNIPLGNIFKETLEGILDKKRSKDIYDGFSRRQRNEELCKRCGYSTKF